PTTPAKPGGQAIMACWSQAGQQGFVFGLDSAGRLCLDLGYGSDIKRLTHAGEPLEPWRWAFVSATYDPATGLARLYQASAEPYATPNSARHDDRWAPGWSVSLPRGDLLLAAREIDAHGRP